MTPHDAPNHDARAFRGLLGHYPTGVCAITATDTAGRPVALVVGSFTSVSLDPPLVGFLPAKSSATWPLLRAAGRFCANILSAEQADLCARLSRRSGDRFAGLDCGLSPLGNPILPGVVAWVDCAITAVTDAGDHDFVLGRVEGMATGNGGPPLVFHRGALRRVA
jgi:flavin reductase (DIM6/NTAB) family NADH-FMN oxidoreductase RutF